VQATVDGAELRTMLAMSSGVVIMCPDSGDASVKESLNITFSELSAKKHKVAIAESFGGNDEPIDKLSQDLLGLGIEPLLKLRVKQEPTEQVRCFPALHAYPLVHRVSVSCANYWALQWSRSLSAFPRCRPVAECNKRDPACPETYPQHTPSLQVCRALHYASKRCRLRLAYSPQPPLVFRDRVLGTRPSTCDAGVPAV
jgi:hypothetical protein